MVVLHIKFFVVVGIGSNLVRCCCCSDWLRVLLTSPARADDNNFSVVSIARPTNIS